MEVRVAAVQIQPLGNLEETVMSAKGLVEAAASAGAKIVCLPEHWLLASVR